MALTRAGDPYLVALKIDRSIQPLVPAAAEANGHTAVVISSAGAIVKLGQAFLRRFVRDALLREDHHRAPPR